MRRLRYPTSISARPGPVAPMTGWWDDKRQFVFTFFDGHENSYSADQLDRGFGHVVEVRREGELTRAQLLDALEASEGMRTSGYTACENVDCGHRICHHHRADLALVHRALAAMRKPPVSP